MKKITVSQSEEDYKDTDLQSQKIPLKISERQPQKSKNSFVKLLGRSFLPARKNYFSSIVLGLVVAGLFSGVFYAFALPYTPGETTNPSCLPTDASCTVVSSVPYTGASSSVDLGSQNVTTLGTGSFASLSLTTSALSVGNGGTGLSSLTQYAILYASTTSAVSQLSLGSSGQVLTSSGSGSAPTWTTLSALPSQTGNSGKFLTTNGTDASWATLTSSDVGLGNVENTALSTWAGSTNITTLGTISSGTWSGTAIGVTKGGTGATSASITAFNNITGYSAAGATGTTSTNLVFSTSPTLTTPNIGAATGTSVVLTNTGGAQATLQYDASNYTSQTTASNGDFTLATTSGSSAGNINLNSAVVGDSTILGTSGTLVFGGSGGVNNESLKFDFESAANKTTITSDTGVTDIDLGSINLITSGTLSLGGSTSGTLMTRVKAGAATESDTNGSLVVDSSNGRLYMRYGGAWHYIAQTAGFQIPGDETIDPVTGEQMELGDLVVGLVSQTDDGRDKFDDGALHAKYVKLSSVIGLLSEEVKNQIAGIPSGGISVSGVVAETSVEKVKNSLSSLGVSIKDGITTIKNLATEKLTAKIAKVEELEMVDKATGQVYCTWIEQGDWQKAKGECSSPEVAVAEDTEQDQSNELTEEQIIEQVTENLEPIIQSQVEAQVQEQVQEEVQNQSEQAVEEESGSSGSESQSSEGSENSNADEAHSKDEKEKESKSDESESESDESEESSQPEALFDILTEPGFLKSTNNILTFAGLALVAIGVMFLIYSIDRRRILKRIDEIKRIKDLP